MAKKQTVKELTWLIDVDDTLALTTVKVVEMMKSLDIGLVDEPTNWRWGLKDTGWYGGEQYTRTLLADNGKFDVEVREGAIDFLNFLKRRGQKIILLTSRRNILEDYTRNWCAFHAIPYDRLLFSINKGIVRGDVMIDDSPANIYQWIEPDKLAFYFQCPHNSGVKFKYSVYPNVQELDTWVGLTRTNLWEQVVEKWRK